MGNDKLKHNEIMTAEDHIKHGNEWPYELDPGDDKTPPDWAHATARGIIKELSGRKGIKHELDAVDMDTRKEIVAAMAEIIREGFRQNAELTGAESARHSVQ